MKDSSEFAAVFMTSLLSGLAAAAVIPTSTNKLFVVLGTSFSFFLVGMISMEASGSLNSSKPAPRPLCGVIGILIALVLIIVAFSTI